MPRTALTPAQRNRLLSLFGLAPGASTDAVHKAWKTRVRALHQAGLDAENLKRLSALNAAWNTLRDATIEANPSMPQAGTSPAPGAKAARTKPRSAAAKAAARAAALAAWNATMATKTTAKTPQDALASILTAIFARVHTHAVASDPHAHRLGLPLRAQVREPAITVHVTHMARTVGDARHPLVSFSGQLLPGRNIVVFPIFHPDSMETAGAFGYHACQIMIGKDGVEASQRYQSVTPYLEQPVQLRFTNLTTPLTLDLSAEGPSTLLDSAYASTTVREAHASLARVLNGTASKRTRPFLRIVKGLFPATTARNPHPCSQQA